MRIYFAGESGQKIREKMWARLIDNRLVSFFFVELEKLRYYMKKEKLSLFIDSGAFSAFSQGVEIDIQEYIAFIKKYKKLITVYANLDVIGDPKATWKNQQIMEKAGLHPMPVFHSGEPFKWLERYIERYDYVAIGGLASKRFSYKDMVSYLDRCFEIICNTPDHMPRVKIHGFGMTSLRLLRRYPWYSVDSTSWVVTGRVGAIYVPKFKDGKWDYMIDPWKVAVSDRSPTSRDKGRHFKTFEPMEREVILNYLKEQGYIIGLSQFRIEDDNYKPEENERWHGKPDNGKREIELVVQPGLCNDYKLRDELNIKYFLEMEKSFPEWPYPFERKHGEVLF